MWLLGKSRIGTPEPLPCAASAWMFYSGLVYAGRGKCLDDAQALLGEPSVPPLEPRANPYRTHLVSVTNDLHRKMTGLNTGSSRYKGLYGRWCQAQEDLLAWENLCGGESEIGGLGNE